MRSYSISEAQENLDALFEQAHRDGAVRIQGDGGQSFVLVPEEHVSSLDIPGITPSRAVTRDNIIQSIQEGRHRYG